MNKASLILLFCSVLQACIILPKNSYEPDGGSLPVNFSIQSKCGGLINSYEYNGKGYFHISLEQADDVLRIAIYFQGLKDSRYAVKNNFIRYKHGSQDWVNAEAKLFLQTTSYIYGDLKLTSVEERLKPLNFNQTHMFGEDKLLIWAEIPFVKENLEIEIPMIENPMDEEIPRKLRYLWNDSWTLFPLNC